MAMGGAAWVLREVGSRLPGTFQLPRSNRKHDPQLRTRMGPSGW